MNGSSWDEIPLDTVSSLYKKENDEEDNQSEDDWYDRMERLAMSRPADDLDESDTTQASSTCRPIVAGDEENEDSYFESMQIDANSRTDTFVGEEDRMWQDLIRTMRTKPKPQASMQSYSTNSRNRQFRQVSFTDESARILISQWLFSYLPKSLVIIKQLEGYLQEKNGSFVVDHVEHPSITVSSFFNETTEAIHVSLFSSLAVDNNSFLLHLRLLRSVHETATSIRLVAVGRDIFESTFPKAGEYNQEWIEYCDMYCCLETSVFHNQFLKTIVDSLPSALELSTLRLDDAEVINSTWKYRSDESIYMVRRMIEECRCQGIRSRSTGELITWCLTYREGALGMLYTLKSHRRIGLAKIVVAGLLLQTLRDKSESTHYPPFCFIEESNDASKSLFRSLGFDKVSEVVWAGLRFVS